QRQARFVADTSSAAGNSNKFSVLSGKALDDEDYQLLFQTPSLKKRKLNVAPQTPLTKAKDHTIANFQSSTFRFSFPFKPRVLSYKPSKIFPLPRHLRNLLPPSEKTKIVNNTAKTEIHEILHQKGPNPDRLVVVIGPCSVHDYDMALKYAKFLAHEAKKYENELLIVMRVYGEKPRSTVGWKGYVNDPNMDDSCDIQKGLYLTRSLMLDITEHFDLPVATEFLDPVCARYIADLVSWGAIGARTVESQVHREMVSGANVPCGFKNGTSGDVQVACDAVVAGRKAYSILGPMDEKSFGHAFGGAITTASDNSDQEELNRMLLSPIEVNSHTTAHDSSLEQQSGLDSSTTNNSGVASSASSASSAVEPRTAISSSSTKAQKLQQIKQNRSQIAIGEIYGVFKTDGNPDAHVVLRGGKDGPNYSREHVKNAISKLVPEAPKKLLIDCSHGNANKDFTRQPVVLKDLCDQVLETVVGETVAEQAEEPVFPPILGVMIESNLLCGNQKLDVAKYKAGELQLKYGVSVTDGCVDLEQTEKMLKDLAAAVSKFQTRKKEFRAKKKYEEERGKMTSLFPGGGLQQAQAAPGRAKPTQHQVPLQLSGCTADGKLPDVPALQVMKAVFPMGTVSGAPKIQAV
ncbi:unnamed protein product, partial [Amoebophrya sp. A120]